MGPDGPIPAPDRRGGLFWRRPDSRYALHTHDADETCVIPAGRAFRTAGEDRRVRRPGDCIQHPSRMPHAFRAGREGLLALWRGSGGVNTISHAVRPDPEARIARPTPLHPATGAG